MQQEKGQVFFKGNAWETLRSFIDKSGVSKIFVIVDENTKTHCLPYFSSCFPRVEETNVLCIRSGEDHKNIDTCLEIWEALSDLGADRSSTIINLGGGVVTDLGGFVAATYQRGISFVNIPTSLLAMVDASVGGKNGVDLRHLKNQIGVVRPPEMVVIEPYFLASLPEPEFLSGTAEMLKHALIKGESTWEEIKAIDSYDKTSIEKLIGKSIQIKNEIVLKDPLEKRERKILNYGHTLGHAIESHFLNHPNKSRLLHGEAIAIGMILAAYLSSELVGLEKEKLSDISGHILTLFPKQSFTESDIEAIQNLTRFDKKNRNGEVLFVLMKDFGKFEWDQCVDNTLILKAFEYYRQL